MKKISFKPSIVSKAAGLTEAETKAREAEIRAEQVFTARLKLEQLISRCNGLNPNWGSFKLVSDASEQGEFEPEELAMVPTEQLASEGPIQTLCISRLLTDGVVATPGGAHFTACVPDYGRDEGFQKEYVAAAGDPDAWAVFRDRFLAVDEDGYQAVTRRAADERAAARAAKEGA